MALIVKLSLRLEIDSATQTAAGKESEPGRQLMEDGSVEADRVLPEIASSNNPGEHSGAQSREHPGAIGNGNHYIAKRAADAIGIESDGFCDGIGRSFAPESRTETPAAFRAFVPKCSAGNAPIQMN